MDSKILSKELTKLVEDGVGKHFFELNQSEKTKPFDKINCYPFLFCCGDLKTHKFRDMSNTDQLGSAVLAVHFINDTLERGGIEKSEKGANLIFNLHRKLSNYFDNNPIASLF